MTTGHVPSDEPIPPVEGTGATVDAASAMLASSALRQHAKRLWAELRQEQERNPDGRSNRTIGKLRFAITRALDDADEMARRGGWEPPERGDLP